MAEAKQKNVVITKKARKKMLKARAGDLTLPTIVGMAFGSGGCDDAGNPVAPTEDQETLKKEILRKPVSGHSYLSDTECRYTCTLTEEEAAGQFISEIGLYDSDGDIVGIKTLMKKGKDDDSEMTFTLDDIF